MNWNVKVGDRVVCVDDSRGFLSVFFCRSIDVRKGMIYTVQRIYRPDLAGEIGFDLVGIPDDHPYRASRFRPVRTTNIDCLRVHLSTIPAHKSEEA